MAFIRKFALGVAIGATAAAAASPAWAGCKRMGFTVNDYGKDGPTRDAKDLLDKHITKWASEQGIEKFTVGKKDVNCELFLNLLVVDEHTCTASATVCWGNDKVPSSEQEASDTTDKPKKKPKVEAAKADATSSDAPKEAASSDEAEKPAKKKSDTAAAEKPAKKSADDEAVKTEAKAEEKSEAKTEKTAKTEEPAEKVEKKRTDSSETAKTETSTEEKKSEEKKSEEAKAEPRTEKKVETGTLPPPTQPSTADSAAATAAEAAASAAERAAAAAERAAAAAERAAAAVAAAQKQEDKLESKASDATVPPASADKP